MPAAQRPFFLAGLLLLAISVSFENNRIFSALNGIRWCRDCSRGPRGHTDQRPKVNEAFTSGSGFPGHRRTAWQQPRRNAPHGTPPNLESNRSKIDSAFRRSRIFALKYLSYWLKDQ